jgi:hypothetical protein
MQLEENQIKTDGIFITSRHKHNIDLFHGQINFMKEIMEKKYEESTTTFGVRCSRYI